MRTVLTAGEGAAALIEGEEDSEDTGHCSANVEVLLICDRLSGGEKGRERIYGLLLV